MPANRPARAILSRTRARLRRGWDRLTSEAIPLLTAVLAAGAAYGIAAYLLGHQVPVQAAIAAWICLGFSPSRNPRKVAELALGATIGVGFGELFHLVFGTGAWQIAVVLLITVAVARVLDDGPTVAIQAGVQAMVVVGLAPVLSSGPASRWVDALVGGLVALAIAVLAPIDVRRQIRGLAHGCMRDLATLLEGTAAGLAAADPDQVNEALERARGSQQLLDGWRSTARDALASTRLSPPRLRHESELARWDRACTFADQAMRSARVIARRSIYVATRSAANEQVAALLAGLAGAVRQLGSEVGAGRDGSAVRPRLAQVAGSLDPGDYPGWQGQSLVAILRSLVVDLAEMTGLSSTAAGALLASTSSPPESPEAS